MRDQPDDKMRLSELIEELSEILEQEGDMFTNIRPKDFRYLSGPKELDIARREY